MAVSTMQIEEIAEAYETAERRRKLYSFGLLLLSLTLLVWGLQTVDAANAGQFWKRWPHVLDYPAEMLAEAFDAGWYWLALPFETPSHPALREPYVWLLLETINIAVIATIISFIIAFGLCFLASANTMPYAWVRWPVRRILDITRAFPEIIIALFLIYMIGANAVVGVIAIAFHTVGALGKLFSEVVENTEMRASEGLESVGASWMQRNWFGVAPQVMPNFLSYALLRLEINVRASAILGFVGAGGLGQALKVVVDVKYGADIASILFLLIVTIFTIDYFSAVMRRRLIGRGGH